MRDFLRKHTLAKVCNILTAIAVVLAFSTLTAAFVAPVAANASPATQFAQADEGNYDSTEIQQPSPAGTCPKGDCIINDYVNPAVKAFAALAGVVITISIVLGGIQYAASTDDPQKVAAAKDRITKAIIALLAFLLLFAFLNWIIPGGIK